MTKVSGLLIVWLAANASAVADDAREPLSGLPLPQGFKRSADPVQSYTICGKKAQTALYIDTSFSDQAQEEAWFAHAIPRASAFISAGGVKTFMTADGTAAVETTGGFVAYFRFSPGLTPAEMKIIGTEPAARSCDP